MPKNDNIFWITFLVVGSLWMLMWWLQRQFGAAVAAMTIGGLFGIVCFAAGALLSFAIGRGTMRGVNDFAATDAQVDRYRMQSFKAMATGNSAMQKAAAQLTVLDAKRVDRLAADKARLLIDADRQQRQSDTWSWDTDDDSGGGDFQEWR